jgi:nucleotide-binding universal stress UspA family protein
VHEAEGALVGAAAAGATATPPAGTPTSPASLAPDWSGRSREETYLAALAARLQPGQVAVEWEVRDGRPAEGLEHCISDCPPDLVVMAAHGRGALSPDGLGAVADYLLRTVSVPILLLRPQGDTELPTPPVTFRSILVALDLAPESLRILEPVIGFACLTQAHVTLLHVVRDNLPPAGPPAVGATTRAYNAELNARCRDAQRELDHLTERLRARGIGAAARVVTGRDVASTVLRELRALRSDVVALTTHGVGGFRDRLLGSVADKVIRASPRPLLVLRPPRD